MKDKKKEVEVSIEPMDISNQIPPELRQEASISNQMILNNMFDASHDLPMKTHIIKPNNFTLLELYGVQAKKEGYSRLSLAVKIYAKLFRVNMVSFNRLSRKEAIKALAHLIETEAEMIPLSKRLRSNIRK